MLRIVYDAATGGSFFATVERASDGFLWNETTQQFEAAPLLADQELPLLEGVAENLQSYRRDQPDLGSPREIILRIHDDNDVNDHTVRTTKTVVIQSLETTTTLLQGPGAVTFTFTSLVGAVPLSDVDVWVTTDPAGANVLANGRTDINGEIIFFLDPGTVYIFQQKAGFNFDPNPQEVTVTLP